MPQVKYTPAKGLIQQTGSGSPNMFHVLAPSDTASVAVAGAVTAIPVTHAVVLKTTGGAEALTLADGSPGQVLQIILVTSGGTGTLTPSRKTGFVSIALADAGDRATLYYVNDTVGWIILGAAGVAAPPAIAIA